MNAIHSKDLSFAQRAAHIRKAKAILAKQPKNATAQFNLAILLDADGHKGAALDALKKARKLKPNDSEILTLLAEISMSAGLYPEARKYARIMSEKSPVDLDYRIFYGDVLQKVGKQEQAIKQYEFVLKRAPNHPNVLSKISEANRMRGFSEEVSGVQKQLETIDPLNPMSIYTEANSRNNTAEECAQLEARIVKALQVTKEKKAAASLYYSRGKIWNDVGDYDKAFEAYKVGNEILELAKAGTDKTIFANSKATFNRAFLLSKANFTSKIKAPIFIIGMPRSGTTLIESICGAHSLVTAGDELNHISNIANGLRDSSPYSDAFTKELTQLSKAEIVNLTKVYMEKTAHLRTSTPYFTDKLPHNFLRLGIIKMLFPEAPVIHCRRHPIDNCLSLYTNMMGTYHNKYKSNLTQLGLYFRQYWQLMEFWRENVPGGFHEVYYEDVVTNTEYSARKMIEHIGLDWEDRVMDRQRSQKSVLTLSAWQVRQPVYTSSAGRWRNYEKHLGPLIDALGPIIGDYENQLKKLTAT